MTSSSAFDDADELSDGAPGPDLAATIASMVRADLSGDTPGAVLRSFAASSPAEQVAFAAAWNDAMNVGGLGDWIDAGAALRSAACAIAVQLTPPDPVPDDNAAMLAELSCFSTWAGYAYPFLVVPGFTPTDAVPAPGVSAVTQRRLDVAKAAFDAGTAPFVLVSGGNVHPPGTPYHEGTEMKKALLSMGLPAARIFVDTRARSSMTNLRNAGRVLLQHGLSNALVITLGGGIAGSDVFGQDFYFEYPDLSTFNLRCRRDLGYEIGDLQKTGPDRIAFTPSPDVTRIAFRDALDP